MPETLLLPPGANPICELSYLTADGSLRWGRQWGHHAILFFLACGLLTSALPSARIISHCVAFSPFSFLFFSFSLARFVELSRRLRLRVGPVPQRRARGRDTDGFYAEFKDQT